MANQRTMRTVARLGDLRPIEHRNPKLVHELIQALAQLPKPGSKQSRISRALKQARGGSLGELSRFVRDLQIAARPKAHELQDKPLSVNELIRISGGNPGAMELLLEIGGHDLGKKAVNVIQREGIIGSDLWLLYNDEHRGSIDQTVASLLDGSWRQKLKNNPYSSFYR